PNRNTQIRACRSMVERLQRDVGELLVQPPMPEPPGLQISLAGQQMAQSLWRSPYVVDPGMVVVQASAPGYVTVRQEVMVQAGQHLAVQLERLERLTAENRATALIDTTGPIACTQPART